MQWPSDQNELARLLSEQNREVVARIEELTSALTPARLAFIPPEGGWSLGQVFEHLCIADDSYLERLRGVVAGHAGSGRAPVGPIPFRPSLGGRLLVGSLDAVPKLPAPKSYRPAPAPRDGVVRAFLDRRAEISALLVRSAGLPWRQIRIVSPVSPLVRMNLGDAFATLVRHAARHLGQIERLLARGDLPPAER